MSIGFKQRADGVWISYKILPKDSTGTKGNKARKGAAKGEIMPSELSEEEKPTGPERVPRTPSPPT